MLFGGALGLVFVVERFYECLAEFEDFVGHEPELAGESVFHGVQGRPALALLGHGTGGVLRVGAVDFRAVWCGHLCVLLTSEEWHGGRDGVRGWKEDVVEGEDEKSSRRDAEGAEVYI